MTPRAAARRLVVPALVVSAVLAVRPGVVVNALTSPAAWATAAGVGLLALGVRAGLRRSGAGDRTARTASGVAVLLCVGVLLAPSFRQRTLVEPLPEAPVAVTPQALAAAPSDPVPPSAPPTVAAPPTAPVSTPRTSAQPAARTSPSAAVRARRAAPTVLPSRPAAVRVPAPERRGELRGIGHRARGGVALRTVDGQAYAVLQDIDVEGTVAPSVHLVAAGRREPAGGVRLGRLKAEKGSFSYRLPAGTDPARPWTLLIWCDPYDTPIAAADLGRG